MSTLAGLPSSYPLHQGNTWYFYPDPFVVQPGDVSQIKVQADLQCGPADLGVIETVIQCSAEPRGVPPARPVRVRADAA